MAFHFRFLSLLRQRRHLLRQAQSALAEAQACYLRMQREAEALRNSIREQEEAFEEEQSRGVMVGSLVAFRDYLIYLEQELLFRKAQEDRAHRDVEERKAALVECEKGVKMLEVLEENERDAFKLLQKQQEQKQLDEISILKEARERDES